MGSKVSKDYLITEILQREKIHDWIYRGDFPSISKNIVLSVDRDVNRTKYCRLYRFFYLLQECNEY